MKELWNNERLSNLLNIGDLVVFKGSHVSIDVESSICNQNINCKLVLDLQLKRDDKWERGAIFCNAYFPKIYIDDQGEDAIKDDLVDMLVDYLNKEFGDKKYKDYVFIKMPDEFTTEELPNRYIFAKQEDIDNLR